MPTYQQLYRTPSCPPAFASAIHRPFISLSPLYEPDKGQGPIGSLNKPPLLINYLHYILYLHFTYFSSPSLPSRPSLPFHPSPLPALQPGVAVCEVKEHCARFDNWFFWGKDQRCYRQYSQGPCPRGQLFFLGERNTGTYWLSMGTLKNLRVSVSSKINIPITVILKILCNSRLHFPSRLRCNDLL